MKRRIALILGVALTIVASIGVGGAAQALWVTNAPVTTTVTAGSVAITSDFSSLGYTFASTSLATPATRVRVTNTGTLQLTGVTAAISGTTGSALAKAVSFQLWDLGTDSTATCPTSNSVTASNWGAASLTLTKPTSTAALQPGHFESYCVISSITSANLATNAGASVSPVITFTGADGTWTSTATATFTLTAPAASNPATVNPGQVGVVGSTGATVTGSNVQGSWNDWPANPGDNIDQTTGVVKDENNVCVGFTVVGSNTTATTWTVHINTSQPPYYGVGLTNSMISTGNATVGGSGVDFTLTGTQQITSSQTVYVQLCLGHPNPTVMDAGTGTYSVGTPVIAGCPSTNPATPAGASAMTSSIPAGSGSACVYLPITGYYPHFYIGYKASLAWTTAIASSTALTANQKTALNSGTSWWGWQAYASSGGSAGLSPTTTTTSGGITTYGWSVSGRPAPMEIANGVTVVIVGTFGLPSQ